RARVPPAGRRSPLARHPARGAGHRAAGPGDEAPPDPHQPGPLDAHPGHGRPLQPDGHQRGQVPDRLRRQGRGRRAHRHHARHRASDVHVEPYEKMLRVRFRIDGVLYEIMQPPLRLKNALTSRIKVMAQLDIAERRLPQDGRIKMKLAGNKEMDFRVSVLPTMFGEKVVLRLLDKSNLQLDMTKLGFEEAALKHFKDAIYKPFGMVLVTGPTGSGKTTTLYSALAELNKVSTNISTAEDPIEFNLVGINQVQMHDEIGLNFAAALRAFLRQDPDVIMVGEIRDFETAEIGVKAALTGHLVLSTLHTNDAPSTVNRLLNMGVEPFLVASTALDLKRAAVAAGMKSLRQSGLSKVAEGMTTIEEILRVTMAD